TGGETPNERVRVGPRKLIPKTQHVFDVDQRRSAERELPNDDGGDGPGALAAPDDDVLGGVVRVHEVGLALHRLHARCSAVREGEDGIAFVRAQCYRPVAIAQALLGERWKMARGVIRVGNEIPIAEEAGAREADRADRGEGETDAEAER